ncbi:MAG: dihydropteroate synthase [Chitinispirillaceae bacterium]|nr:dihydropteroate synthase [Chitinispirillaceae bacterium]
MNVIMQPFALMGIVNVTPDSFYDGGRYSLAEKAVAQGMRLAEEGASLVDIGGASTRPGAAAVPPDVERERILPVVRALAQQSGVSVSVDTASASVAAAAIDAGATWINDISAGRNDPEMKTIAAQSGCTMVLMHSRGTPPTMQQLTDYNNLAGQVRDELMAAVDVFIAAGVDKKKIVIDPGIGFAKTAEQCMALLHAIGTFLESGFPVLVGTSRKSFIGRITGRDAADRLAGTLGSVAAAYRRGIRFFRVHDVAATADLLKVIYAIEHSGPDTQP